MAVKRIVVTLTWLMLAAHAGAGAQDAVNASGALVVEVYGDKALVEIDSRRFLVEPLSAGTPFPAAPGSRIDIAGRRDGNVVTPERLTLPSGDVVRAAGAGAAGGSTAPPSPAAVPSVEDQLAREGITPLDGPYRKHRFTEVIGRDAAGRKQIVLFDPNGRLREIEDAEHRHVDPDSPAAVGAAEVEGRLRAAGYASVQLLDQRRYRFLFSAVSGRGEPMELTVDRGGNILKRVWVR